MSCIREYMLLKILHLILLLSLSVLLSGCLTARQTAEVNYVNGTVVDTLSSNVSLQYASSDRHISGSGYIMYRQPDQIRVVILSPFGSVLQDVYVSGDRVTVIDPGNGVAFSGSYAELPIKGDFSGWRHIHWLIDFDQPERSRVSATIERVNRFGQSETAVIENGLFTSKTTAEGGTVRYARYTAVQGAALPLEIVYETAAKEVFTITLDEPEINVPFAVTAFTPNVGKHPVYPLSRLR